MAMTIEAAIAALDEAGKTSFCFWLADQAQRSLRSEDAERVGIAHAMTVLRSWRRGDGVSGDALNDLLLDANDNGLFAMADARQPRDTDHVIEVVGGVICYIACLAYKNAGEHLPDGINQVDDGTICWATEKAIAARMVTEEGCVLAIQAGA